jgi:hypothetical protein
MWVGRFRRELQELNQQCAGTSRDEETAMFELARSARAFSQRAREAADDTLAFSATLVRAGEVEAAQKLIHDLEQEMHGEKAALAERVDEVQAAAARRRAKMTRLRLARIIAAAVLTAGLLSLTTAGWAVASFLANLDEHSRDGSSSRSARFVQPADSSLRHASTRHILLLDGTTVMLTQDQFRRFKSLSANPNLDREELERLLVDLVGPRIAARLVSAIAEIANGAAQAASDVGSHVRSKVKEPAALTNGGGASSEVPRTDKHEPVEKPAKPSDDSGIIDAPLGSEPKTPPVLGDD